MDNIFEGAFIPLLAKDRWPLINAKTRLLLVPGRTTYVLPLPPFGQEEIELHRLMGCKPIRALGYGEVTDSLLIDMREGD